VHAVNQILISFKTCYLLVSILVSSLSHHHTILWIVLMLTLNCHTVTDQLSVWFVTDGNIRWQEQFTFLNTKDCTSGMFTSLHDNIGWPKGTLGINFEHFNSSTELMLPSVSVRDPWNYSSTKTLGSFPCVSCGRQYRRRKALMAHVKYECGKAPQFQCPYCSHRFTQNSSLRAHVRRKHPSFWNDWICG
jgi:DNA-directed RNA polymerase subunit RPC12/RpoP